MVTPKKRHPILDRRDGATDLESIPLVLIDRANALAESKKDISLSELQRSLQIGYSTASRLMQILELQGTLPKKEGL